MSWMPEGAATRAFHDASPTIAFLICFFPIVVDTLIGLRSVPKEVLWLSRSMVASQWKTFAKIQFPAALPHIFAGLKVASTLAVVGAVVGEFVAADRGLGYQLIVANGILDVQSSFAVLVTLTLTVCASVSRSAAHCFTIPASC
jgi:NitT/TauT family transport system permease protein